MDSRIVRAKMMAIPALAGLIVVLLAAVDHIVRQSATSDWRTVAQADSLDQSHQAKTSDEFDATKASDWLSRLADAMDTVNRQLGTNYAARLGESGRGVEVSAGNIISVDTSLYWQLEKDELTTLLAYGCSLHRLGGSVAFYATKQGGQVSEARHALNMAADEHAGWVAGRLGYPAGVFARLLQKSHRNTRKDPWLEARYPREHRVLAFERGYTAGVQGK